MDSSREGTLRNSRTPQFSMYVPTAHLLMTSWRPGAGIWAPEGKSNPRSPLFAMSSGWPAKCFRTGMQTKSSTLRSELAEWKFRINEAMLRKG